MQVFPKVYPGLGYSFEKGFFCLSLIHIFRGNQSHGTEGEEPLPGNTYTLARMMKDAGYATGAFGKWGLGYPCSEGDPCLLYTSRCV